MEKRRFEATNRNIKSDRAYVMKNLPSENCLGGCLCQSNVALLPRWSSDCKSLVVATHRHVSTLKGEENVEHEK